MAEPCYSIVRKPKNFECSNEFSLKKKLEGDDMDKCMMSIEEILQNLLDGMKFPTSLLMPVINRYQMNIYQPHAAGLDKRIKKLLYILWECLPKRGPDGKFLDRMVMVCGAFDKDLKHPNQYVCGSVLRTLSKTQEADVIRELVSSIEKCLDWSHAYQRKNAVLAMARIYKNFPDMNPDTPRLIAEYLLKENDDECKRAALQALLEIGPEEAKAYLHTSNIPDIHCMNASIQLLFVELIQRVFKKGSEESELYLSILTSLIKSSSSPSVRYQAAVTLMRFSRNPDAIRLAASCFIDICGKESDNNIKLITLDSLMNLRRINGAERVLPDFLMDILSILQSAKDLELHERILRLALDLLSPLNVGDVVSALRQEMRKMRDINIFSNPQETIKYRKLLVNTIHQIANRFPQSIVENEMMDSLFDLLLCNSIGEKTGSKLILLFGVFMANNPHYQTKILSKVQHTFNLVKDNPSIHSGLLQLLGDFSETKEQIEKSYLIIKESLGPLPIVRSELRRLEQDGSRGDAENESSSSNPNKPTPGSHGDPSSDVDGVTKRMNRLVTADGSYAKQSAINYENYGQNVNEDRPSLRSYFLRNSFGTTPTLSYCLLKMACRYKDVGQTKAMVDKMIARFIFIIASIQNLGSSNLKDNEGNPIRLINDHSLNLTLCRTILHHLVDKNKQEIVELMKKTLTDNLRSELTKIMKNIEVDRFSLNDEFGASFTNRSRSDGNGRFDDKINISLFAKVDDDVGIDVTSDNSYDTSKQPEMSNNNLHEQMSSMVGEIPLTGTSDPIYAYCEFDVNQYDIGLKIHLENRTKEKTFENVTLELSARGEGFSNFIDRPESIVLGPRAKGTIETSIKVISAENRRLFGCIAFDDSTSDDREQFIILNDISINITDYISPTSIGFDEYRGIWRDCEWENKVTVKTKHNKLKDYLNHLVKATNMRCITADRGFFNEDCSFLSANLYAKSSFGEQALVNVSTEKETPKSPVTGSVKIRSRSQGMALSLGEKIQSVQ